MSAKWESDVTFMIYTPFWPRYKKDYTKMKAVGN